MADVFISYSRRDGDFVRQLHAFLSESGREVWVDWEDIPPASQWMQDIEESIDAADSVVFVVSGSSLASEYCLAELKRAQERGKRIVPLACDGADPGGAPEGLRQLNWIWCRESDDRGEAFAKVTRALDTDLEWAKAHTRLLVRAVEWEARGDSSRLLRGRDLEEAARQLEANAGKEPVPTELQQRYLLASRRAAAKRQRIVLASVLAALAVSVALGVVAFLQRNTARSATRSATSVALASAANDRVATKPDQALLLALGAYSSSPSAQARNAAVTALQAARPLGVAKFLHGDAEVRNLDFAPDRRTLAVGSADGSLRLWDVRAGGNPVELRGPGSPPVVGVEFTRDGRTVAAGSAHGVIRLWDVASRRPVGRTIDANRPIRAFALSPNGKTVAALDFRRRIWLWDLRGGKPRRLAGPTGDKAMLAFSPDGKTLAAGASDFAQLDGATPGVVALLDVERGRLLGLLPSRKSVMALAFSPDGDTLVTAGYQEGGYRYGSDPADRHGEVRLWDVQRFESVGSVRSDLFVHSVAFAPDGRTVAVGRDDGSIQLAAPATEKWVGSPLQASLDAVVSTLAFSRDGRTIAAAAAGETSVRVWNLRKRGTLIRTIRRGNFVGNVALSADGATAGTVAAAHVDGYDGVLLVRKGAAEPVRMPVPANVGFDEVALSGDGSVLAAVGGDAIYIWDVRRSGPPARLYERGAQPLKLVLDETGETLATWGFGAGLWLWDVPRRELVGSWGEARAIKAAAFVGDERILVTAGADGSVKEWDPELADRLLRRPLQRVQDAALSADGFTVAFVDRAGVVWLWDRRSDAALAPLPGGPRSVPEVALSADGKTLALAPEDGDVQLWDVQARTPIGQPLPGTRGAGAAFSTGSVATSADDAVRLWDGILWRDLSHLRSQVCGLVAGDLTRAEWTAIAPGLPYPSICER